MIVTSVRQPVAVESHLHRAGRQAANSAFHADGPVGGADRPKALGHAAVVKVAHYAKTPVEGVRRCLVAPAQQEEIA